MPPHIAADVECRKRCRNIDFQCPDQVVVTFSRHAKTRVFAASAASKSGSGAQTLLSAPPRQSADQPHHWETQAPQEPTPKHSSSAKQIQADMSVRPTVPVGREGVPIGKCRSPEPSSAETISNLSWIESIAGTAGQNLECSSKLLAWETGFVTQWRDD